MTVWNIIVGSAQGTGIASGAMRFAEPETIIAMRLSRSMVVVADRPRKRTAWTAMAVVLAAGFGYGCFLLGSYRYDRESEHISILAADCVETDDIAWFKELDLAQVVDAGANEQLRRTIKILGDRIQSLEEEVRFYRRLVAPMDDDVGFNIERLKIVKTRDHARFAYTLFLTQAVDRDRWIEGSVEIDIVGEQSSAQRSLSLAELSEESEYPIKFGFLYFEDFSGQMTLPKEFLPQEVRVTVEVDTGHRFERVFAWSVE